MSVRRWFRTTPLVLALGVAALAAGGCGDDTNPAAVEVVTTSGPVRFAKVNLKAPPRSAEQKIGSLTVIEPTVLTGYGIKAGGSTVFKLVRATLLPNTPLPFPMGPGDEITLQIR